MSGSLMKCQFCDEPAAVHMTQVDAATGRKTEVHACLRHAANAGLPADTAGKMARAMEATHKAMGALQAFVASERRVPSRDELRALGVADAILPADPAGPLYQPTLAQIDAMARMMLTDQGPPPAE